MKKIYHIILIFSLMIGVSFCLSNNAYAKEEFYANGYTYTVDDNNEATIIDVDSNVTGEITVPKSLGGADVVRIGEYAFMSSEITSVSILDNIVSIGEAAFLQCVNLEKVYISNSVSQIGDLCFWNCKKLQYIDVSESNENYSSDSYGVLFDKHQTRLIIYPMASNNDEYVIPSTVKIIEEKAFQMNGLGFKLKKLVLQEGIEEIRGEAFYNNRYFEEFYVPSTVSYIDSTAFDYCINIKRFVVDKKNKYYYSDDAGALLDIDGKNLVRFPSNSLVDSYVIPSGVETIQENAFMNCSNISEVTLSQSCISIGESAFESSSLKYISVNGGLKDIGRTAFYNCALLTHINIPHTVEEIGDWAFMNCYSLEMFSVDDNNSKYFSDEFGALFDKIDNKLLYYPIGNKSQTYILFDGTTKICDSAFMGAKYLKKISLPNTVTIIEDNAFYGCELLEYLILPESVEYIHLGSFEKCISLSGVVMLSKETAVESNFYRDIAIYGFSGSSAEEFAEKNSLRFVSLYDGIKFSFEDGVLEFTDVEKIPSTEDRLIYPWLYYSAFADAVVINNSSLIGKNAFFDLESTLVIIRGDEVTIEDGAFNDCSKLGTLVVFSNLICNKEAFSGETNNARWYVCDEYIVSGAIDVTRFSYSQGIVSFDKAVSMSYYDFFNTIAAVCSYYDDVEQFNFVEFVASDFQFFCWTDKENLEGRWMNRISNAEFTVTIGEGIEQAKITFNQLCEGVANGEISKFNLVATGDYVEIDDTEVVTDEGNLFQRFLKAIITFFNKIVKLFKRK